MTKPFDNLRFGGGFYIERRSPGGVLLGKRSFVPNRVMNAAMNAILEAFRGTAFPSAWYCGLISSTSFSAIAAADTMASHAGWTELTGISNATRPLIFDSTSPASASQQITNSAAAVFTANAVGTVKGIFIASNNTIGGTTGTLWAASQLTADQQFSSGETVSITYVLQASSGA